MNFTHLHLHTEYSLLDGACRINDLVKEARKLGMDSLAITDHGVMFGVMDFYEACQREGIKPILGCEVYTALGSRFDKDPERDKHQGHFVLLAENNEGYKNLLKLVSLGYTEGFYYKPRIDREILRKYSKGLIGLSACLAGDIPQKLLVGDYEGAKRDALEFLEIFGENNFFLEVQNQGLAEEEKIFPMMVSLSEETGIPLVATNDVHYIKKEDAENHDILLCIQTQTTVDEEDRMRFPNNQFYLKSPEEMAVLFPDNPQAIINSVKIAERCNVSLDFGELHLPDFQAPDNMTNRDYLRFLCTKGLEERYGAKSEELKERLQYELSVIENMRYVEYFLIVWDFISYAKSKGIMVGPGRGSAAGSLVAYSLGITDVDPIKYGLIFERFLNPERISMPDIDIDFCYERRQEVIDYVVEKYGSDKVAQIITFGTMKAKAAIRDVGRALSMPYTEVDAIAKAVPNSLNINLGKALKTSTELREKYESSLKNKKLIDTAMAVEGMPRHASTHAAGVVISKEPIVEYAPLYLAEKGISTQYTMTAIEKLGLLKMDFLGLRNLTVIRDSLDMIKRNHGITIDFSKMEYDDKKVFEMISQGNTQGIFQLESPGMTQFMKNQKPDNFEDIIAGISLYRPGPMASIPSYIQNKKDPQGIEYLHEALKPILSVTYGCLIYQEQVMEIVRLLAGYSYGRSDIIRRAMGKKKMDVMLKEQEVFISGNDDVEGCKARGIPESVAEQIFNQMASFAEYAFNKSHAAAYAVIAYQTAYLKAYFPLEFMASLLTSVMGDSATVAKYIRNCNEMDIELLPPDLNYSFKNFSVESGKIRFGLLGVKNVGEALCEAIIQAREEKGHFTDIISFFSKLDTHVLNKKALESLIQAGAFDSIHSNRAQLLALAEGMLESAQKDARRNIEGQISLFQDSEGAFKNSGNSSLMNFPLPNIKDFEERMKLSLEKDNLGVYLSGHPLDSMTEEIQKKVTLTSDMLQGVEVDEATEIANETGLMEITDGMKVTMAGVLVDKKTLLTKSGKLMAFISLEDFYGTFEVVVFPNTYEICSSCLVEDSVLLVRGKLDFKEDESPKILAEHIDIIEKSEKGSQLLKLKVPESICREEMETLKEIFASYPGDCPINIYLGSSGKRLAVSEDLNIKFSEQLKDALENFLGKENIKYCEVEK